MPSGRRLSPWISPSSSSATSTVSHAANRSGISTAGARTRSRRPRSSRRRSPPGGGAVGASEVLRQARLRRAPRSARRPVRTGRSGRPRQDAPALDEAHRARRRSRGPDATFGPAAPNNLLGFLRKTSSRTKSLLLATATPVQLHPIEAYDLLDALAHGSEAVLGGPGSRWRNAQASLDLVLGNTAPPDRFDERWEWWRNLLACSANRYGGAGYGDSSPAAASRASMARAPESELGIE